VGLTAYAAHLGTVPSYIYGSAIMVGDVFGGAMNDLINVETTDPPDPDPFV
jgi:hypothetical protein